MWMVYVDGVCGLIRCLASVMYEWPWEIEWNVAKTVNKEYNLDDFDNKYKIW